MASIRATLLTRGQSAVTRPCGVSAGRRTAFGFDTRCATHPRPVGGHPGPPWVSAGRRTALARYALLTRRGPYAPRPSPRGQSAVTRSGAGAGRRTALASIRCALLTLRPVGGHPGRPVGIPAPRATPLRPVGYRSTVDGTGAPTPGTSGFHVIPVSHGWPDEVGDEDAVRHRERLRRAARSHRFRDPLGQGAEPRHQPVVRPQLRIAAVGGEPGSADEMDRTSSSTPVWKSFHRPGPTR